MVLSVPGRVLLQQVLGAAAARWHCVLIRPVARVRDWFIYLGSLVDYPSGLFGGKRIGTEQWVYPCTGGCCWHCCWVQLLLLPDGTVYCKAKRKYIACIQCDAVWSTSVYLDWSNAGMTAIKRSKLSDLAAGKVNLVSYTFSD